MISDNKRKCIELQLGINNVKMIPVVVEEKEEEI